MRRATLIVLAGALACAGCAVRQQRHRHIDVRTVVEDGKVRTESPLAFNIRENYKGHCVNYSALAGPTTQPERGLHVAIRNTFTQLTISGGWLYLRGLHPHAGGRLVNASSTDATFIISSEPTRDIVVFLCTDSRATLTVTASTSGAQMASQTIGQVNQYVIATEKNGQVQITSPMSVFGQADIERLIADTRSRVEGTAGFVWCGPEIDVPPVPPPH